MGRVISITGGAAFLWYCSMQSTKGLGCCGMGLDQVCDMYGSIVFQWKYRISKGTCKTKQICPGYLQVI